MIRLYRRVSARCRTINQLNLLHIALDNRMTPGEAMRLHAESMAQPGWRSDWHFWPTKALARTRRNFPRLLRFRGLRDERAYEHRRWIDKLHAMYMKSGKPQPEPFVRCCVRRGVSFYSAAGDRKDKTLMICFTGASGRLLMPLPVFLQHLDAQQTDVLVLRYPRGAGFRRGLASLGDSFEASVDAIRPLVPLERYRRAVALGTSGGGLPALLAALRLGLSAAMSVGGSGPGDSRWHAAFGESAAAVLNRYAAELRALPKLFLVCGFDHAADKASAAAMAGLLPAELIEIDNPQGKVGHNALLPPLMRGELRSLLDASLLAAPARST